MIKKIIVVFILSLSFINLVGCSSFDDKPIKNAMDDYFEWFEDLVNGKEDPEEEKEENIEEDDDIEVIAPESNTSNNYSNFVLSEEHIVF